jgi:peptidoglycan/LPS O-acetylase OafA/YrhL
VLTDVVVGEAGTGDVSDGASPSTYRPHLDGLRAVAVYLVVFFHAGSGRLNGGYIGVDVFFVLSGFLVTQLLLRDIERSGSVRYSRFYARRFRRLLPAAFVALLVTAAVFAAIASPVEVADALGSFKAAFLYSTNWYFIHQATGYFGANITTNPVLHFWSLAVEEQFYLVWPLILGGAFLATRRLSRARQLHLIRIGVSVLAFVSLALALSWRTSNPNRAYYGTDARAYQLLAGALIALLPAAVISIQRFRRSTRIASAVSLVALVVFASEWVHLDAIERGIAATIIASALIVSLEGTSDGPVKRALSHPTVVYLGKISYGTYLWHWLVILVVIRTFHPSTGATIAIACLVATAMASLSFEILERPVRTWPRLDRHRRVVIATGLAVSLVSALVLIPRIMDPAHASAPVAQASTTVGFTPVPPGLDFKAAENDGGPFITCLNKPASACTVVKGTGRHILLMGDSHAWMMIPAFEDIARRENLTLSVSVRGGCPWQRDLYVLPVTVNGQTLRTSDCVAQKNDTYTRVIPELKPDVIAVMEVAHQDPRTVPFLGPDGHPLQNKSPTAVRWIEDTTARSLTALRADGRKVLIIEPIPIASINPLDCLSQAKVLEDCRYVANTAPDPIENFFRQAAKRNDDVVSADFDRLVCPFLPICDPLVNGKIVKRDGTHLTEAFAISIAPQIDAYLKQTGLLPR